MTIGLIGFGELGSAVAERFRRQEHAVTVYNRTLSRPLAQGHETVNTPAELLQRSSSLILLALADTATVNAVLGGQDGLLAANLEDRLIVDLTSHSPEEAPGLHERIHRAGGRYLEAPVAGTPEQALTGELELWASGHLADFEAARPVLELIAWPCIHAGGPGAASRIKQHHDQTVAESPR
ncbi:MAG: NAD(P)-binding domain-containing protein [Oleiphilaceae bacterium]|nr:NAD(P)-binding domain-containing protein [Oleiphilaceae bacterium]